MEDPRRWFLSCGYKHFVLNTTMFLLVMSSNKHTQCYGRFQNLSGLGLNGKPEGIVTRNLIPKPSQCQLTHAMHSFGTLRCCKDIIEPSLCHCYPLQALRPTWIAVFATLPYCADELNAKLFVYTRQLINTPLVMPASRWLELKDQLVWNQWNRPTKIISHGSTDNGEEPWIVNMKNELLAEEDVNVLVIDWREGAKKEDFKDFFRSVSNTRVIADMLVSLVHFLGISSQNLHLIGHSLGAHLSGHFGMVMRHRFGTIPSRITGLDPAGLAYHNTRPDIRLDPTDAMFVDVIHTDAEPLIMSGFGIIQECGHADFYPNGGNHQPACPEEHLGLLSLLITQNGVNVGSCSHGICRPYFTNSIRTCRFQAPTKFPDCTMGYHVSPNCRGSFYPVTSNTAPYC